MGCTPSKDASTAAVISKNASSTEQPPLPEQLETPNQTPMGLLDTDSPEAWMHDMEDGGVFEGGPDGATRSMRRALVTPPPLIKTSSVLKHSDITYVVDGESTVQRGYLKQSLDVYYPSSSGCTPASGTEGLGIAVTLTLGSPKHASCDHPGIPVVVIHNLTPQTCA